MRFRTELIVKKSNLRLHPNTPLITVGSCFAENIAGRMRTSLWDACNPLGTLFNPLSIAKVMDLVLNVNECPDTTGPVPDDMIFNSGGVWHSWLFGTSFSSVSRQELVNEMNCALRMFADYLLKSQALIVTLGTANYYSLSGEGDRVVANCHKMPSGLFLRRRLSVREIADGWNALCSVLHTRYPQLNIIFTVSPVRHIKDGFTENARSKATLILAVEEICADKDYCHYFPAYELMTDDLRDYRFYASDMVHPSEEGVDYIWEKFQEAFLDADDMALLKKGADLYLRCHHRFMVPDAPSSKEFAAKTNEIAAQFSNNNPGMLNPLNI